MRKWIVTFFLLAASMAWAQDDSELRQIYMQAEEEYTIGHFDASIRLLNENIAGFDGALKTSAYRLLSLCYLGKDHVQDAEKYASLLLKEDPYYSTSIHDPLRFADMIERLKRGEEATITTASQQEESIEEAPVPVTLITEEMIKASGARTLADLLTLYVPGMSFVEGAEMNVAMHGIYSSSQEKILIMLDGHRLNSRATNSEAPDYRTSLDKIKQIEVLRGPASSLYGNVALTAVVNIITKKGNDVDGLKFSGGIGNNHTYRANFLMGKSSLGINFMGWASVFSSYGEKRNIGVNDKAFYGKVLQPGSMYINGYNHKPAYDIGITVEWNDLKLLFNTQYAKKVSPYVTVFYPGLYDYDRYRKINGSKPGRSRQSSHLELSYEKTWKQWLGKFTAFVDMENVSYYDIVGDTILPNDRYVPVKPGEVVGSVPEEGVCDYGVYQVQSWNDYTYGASFQVNRNFHRGFLRGNFLLGTQLENYVMKDNSMVAGDHFDRIIVTYSDANRSIHLGEELNFSVFTQLKTYLGDNFIFNGGVRYDYKHRYNDNRLNEISPRLSLIYKLNQNVHFKLGYSHSFVDAPFFYRASTIATYAGGNKLDAESMDAIQLSYNHSVRNSGLKYEVNLYYNSLKDIIYFGTPNASGEVLSNSGSLKVGGVEGVLSYEKSRLYANLNMSYQRVFESNNYTITHSHINGIPDYLLNLLCRYQIWKTEYNDLYVRGNMSFQSKQYAPLVSNLLYVGEQVLYDPNYQLGARAIFNVGVDYQYKGVAASLSVYNLLNTSYYQGGSMFIPLPQQKRSFIFTLSYAF